MSSVMERAAPDAAELNNQKTDVGVSTRYLCGAPYLRKSMIPRKAPASKANRYGDQPQEDLDVGSAFCRLALSKGALASRMTAVDVTEVIRHAQRGWYQTLLRDLALGSLLLTSVVLAPFGTAAWLLLGAFLLILPWAWKRWRRHRRPIAWLLALYSLIVVAVAVHGGGEARGLMTPIAALVGDLIVYYIDSVASWFQIRRIPGSPEKGASSRPCTKPLSTGFAAADRAARENVVVYERGRIIGAGENFGKHTLTVPIDEPAEGKRVEPFLASDLLRFISDHLRGQGVADSITHALPDLQVDRVLALPIKSIREAPNRIDDELLHGMLVNPPSGSSERVYARAQATTWHGEVVGTIFVSVALEGRYLRLVVLPYVLGPIVPELRVADAIVKRSLPAHLLVSLPIAVREFSLAVRAIRARAVAVAARLNREQRRQPVFTVDKKQPKTMTLRERYSVKTSSDLHQAEDGTRIIQIMEQRVFSVTEIFLKDRGIATHTFQQQANQVLNSYVIIGSNNNMAAAPNAQAGNLPDQGRQSQGGQ
jgi:hypothetical protein